MSSSRKAADGIVALFNASDDTIDMIQTLLREIGGAKSLVWCHFASLRKGTVDFAAFMAKHNPGVVIFDISPPYDENWQFFKTMRDADVMRGRGSVLTTTNKNRLDEVLGTDSQALEVVGRPKDREYIRAAIMAEHRKTNRDSLAMPAGNSIGFRPRAGFAVGEPRTEPVFVRRPTIASRTIQARINR
jgi:hypothetical protein